tara:strand:+ start:675 stop:944 length:270 start_codon:yes stop_codon:yes gene_type:complete
MRFNTKIIGTGECYGRGDCLVNDGAPLIEFYDPRYQHTPIGQFVSRYAVSTILGHTGGLCLFGGEPEWFVNASDMAEIRAWLVKMEVAA